MSVINPDFKILTKLEEFTLLLDKTIENVPNKDKYYKDLIRNKVIELLDNICFVNNVRLHKREYELFRGKIKTNIDIIDFLLERIYLKKYISVSTLEKAGYKLKEINIMANAFLKYVARDES